MLADAVEHCGWRVSLPEHAHGEEPEELLGLEVLTDAAVESEAFTVVGKVMSCLLDRLGKRGHRISLVSRSDDNFKRSEYLRQVPMTDEHFKRVYGFRPDAESGNKDIEEAWHLKRMPAWGWHNQSLRMILHAGQVNAEAWAIHCQRLLDHGRLDDFDGPEPAAA